MKKNGFILIIAIGLALLVLILYFTSSNTTFKRALSDFAVQDTSTVTKIFMSDKNNNTLNLSRVSENKWLVNGKYEAQKKNIDMLLETIMELEVKSPVPIKAHDNIIRNMAAASVKVEIYQWVNRIDFLGLQLFPHEKLTKVFYVGSATQSNQGTYMLMEHSSEPFVVYIPNFRGFVSPRFTPIEKYWRDYSVFRIDPREISSVTVTYPYYPDSSFTLQMTKGGNPEILILKTNQVVKDYDTLKVWGFLTAFRNVNFEALLNELDKHFRDSVTASQPFCIVSVRDTTGTVNTVKTFFKKPDPGSEEYYGRKVPYDLDRLYALVNDGKDFTLIQYFVFDKIFRTGPFFMKNRPRR